MHKGFIFNHNKCVGCGACSAACLLENGWKYQPRTIYKYTSRISSVLSILNLSISCNHCESPVCMDGCPTNSYSRDQITGAIILDDNKCIGCQYCQWNCPYDAPKRNEEQNTFGKCNLCYSRLKEGHYPACTTACPTGALRFGELSDKMSENTLKLFSDKRLNPAIGMTGNQDLHKLSVIPDNFPDPEMLNSVVEIDFLTGKWSLVAFSYLTLLSVALLSSSFLNGKFPSKVHFLEILMISGISTFFHLGKKLRAWRAVANFRSSPLSREIALFILYSAFSVFSVITQTPFLIIVSSIIGLVMLISIDNVYNFSVKRKLLTLHSGQTFITCLIIISFLSGAILPFIFIGSIKIILSGYSFCKHKLSGYNSGIRLLRISLLILAGASLINRTALSDNLIIFLFLGGELLDRIIFYYDFNPLNINAILNNHFNAQEDETKRG